MKGRKAKPAELKAAQGNPGNRPLVPQPLSESAPASGPVALPFAKLSADALTAYTIVGAELRHLNFIRSTDEPLLLRYCDALARFWRVTRELDELGGETYDCPTTTGATMLRMRPQFMVQERLSKRLESMEDRLGLSPMARQQYLLRMAQGAPRLPLGDAPSKRNADDTDQGDPPRADTPFGFLKPGAVH